MYSDVAIKNEDKTRATVQNKKDSVQSVRRRKKNNSQKKWQIIIVIVEIEIRKRLGKVTFQENCKYVF